MGLDIGLEQEGINILLACETDNACRRTIVANEPGIGLIGDIRDYTVGEILEYANLRENGQVDIVVGGPPRHSARPGKGSASRTSGAMSF
jgi:DNA (cytosine-5)-methyltransferase 1